MHLYNLDRKSGKLSVDLESIPYYKRLIVARIYLKGDKDSIKRQNIEYLLKRNIFFLGNGRYGFTFTPLASWLSCWI